MVNTGRPSRGCLTCRRRRVKCDENRPSCKRCTKLEKMCEWKDEWNSLVRPQESWAKDKVSQRVERVQHLRSKRDADRAGGFGSFALQQSPSVSSIPQQCHIGPEVYAINRFYVDYACSVAMCPFLYSVQPMYSQENIPSCLHSVIPAVALASAAKQQRRYDLMQEADKHYGRSLTRLAQCLNNPDVAKHDAVLLTVYLLGLYEFISYDKHPTRPSPYKSHGPGRLALLRLRGREQLRTQMGRNLFLIVYREHLISALDEDLEPLEECPTWIYGSFSPSPAMFLTLLIHDVSCALWKQRKIFQKAKATRESMLLMLHTGVSLHKIVLEMLRLFQTCEMHDNLAFHFYALTDARRNHQTKGPDMCMRQLRKDLCLNEQRCAQLQKADAWRQTLEDMTADSTVSEDLETSEYTSVYLKSTRAVSSSVCRAVHIRLLDSLARGITAFQRLFSDSGHASTPAGCEEIDLAAFQVECNETMRRHASDILDAVPDALGRCESEHEHEQTSNLCEGMGHRAYMVLWPLRTALGAETTSKETRDSIRKELAYINESHGIGIALEALEYAWPSFSQLSKRDVEFRGKP